MSQIPIPPGQFAKFTVQGLDVNGAPEQISGTAKIDNYAAAAICPYGPHTYAILPKTTPAEGASLSVNVTFSAKDAAGNALPPAVVTAILQGPPAPPLAVSLSVDNLSAQSPAGQPAFSDPGTDTIPITV